MTNAAPPFVVEPSRDLPGVWLHDTARRISTHLTIREAQQLAVDILRAILTPTQDGNA